MKKLMIELTDMEYEILNRYADRNSHDIDPKLIGTDPVVGAFFHMLGKARITDELERILNGEALSTDDEKKEGDKR